MLLVLDVGNTNIKIGLYNKKELLFSFRISTDREKTQEEYAVTFHSLFQTYEVPTKSISGSIISCVVPQITQALTNALHTLIGVAPMIVGPGIKTGLNIKINNPAILGADLVVSSVAAAELYPCPCIIFGLGTATTVLVLDETKNMVGCSIAPGVSVSLSALIAQSSLLPSISIEAPKSIIGRNTEESMKSGSVLGTACMIDGMIERIEEELGTACTTVATGGLASVITPNCKRNVECQDNLLLEGLRMIYEKNTVC